MKKILAIFLIAIGVIVSFANFKLTGAVINNWETGAFTNLLIAVSLLGGLILLLTSQRNIVENYEGNSEKMWESHRILRRESSRGNNTSQNKKVAYASEQRYTDEHGEKPTKKQLKKYIRELHESGELGEILDRFETKSL